MKLEITSIEKEYEAIKEKILKELTMSEQYKISIITPTYNCEKYLEETILSVLNQSYQNYEHVIVDGGSTDNTISIISKYPHIKLITGKDNGMYDAINKGIKAASGDIIGCLNSDDLYYSNTLEIINSFFTSHPKTIVINGDCFFMDKEGEKRYILHSPKYNRKNYISLDSSIIYFPTVFWRKELHNKVGYFDDKFKMAADFDFYARIGEYYNIDNTHRLLAKFRLHPESLTSTKRELMRKEVHEINKKYGTIDNPISQIRKTYTFLIFYLVNAWSLAVYWIRKKFLEVWK
jgi:glycosyltransferase involved in cell wall biosynthesis